MSVIALNTLLGDIREELPSWLSIAVSDPTDPGKHDLFPTEQAAVARAIVRRRDEFAAGRRAARNALTAMNKPASEIPMAEDRSPVWPTGVTGSITHTQSACVAMLASTDNVKCIGVDLEEHLPIENELIPSICTENELNILNDEAPSIAARRIFCGKEAAYKTQYQISHTLIGFEALELCRKSSSEMVFKFTRSVAPFRKDDTMTIRQWADHGVILSVAWMH